MDEVVFEEEGFNVLLDGFFIDTELEGYRLEAQCCLCIAQQREVFLMKIGEAAVMEITPLYEVCPSGSVEPHRDVEMYQVVSDLDGEGME